MSLLDKIFNRNKNNKNNDTKIHEGKKIEVDSDNKKDINLKSVLNNAKQLEELGDVNKAIKEYEKYVLNAKELGPIYGKLMNLYNLKLQEARENKEDEKIQYYLDKIDALMQRSKDLLRGRI